MYTHMYMCVVARHRDGRRPPRRVFQYRWKQDIERELNTPRKNNVEDKSFEREN